MEQDSNANNTRRSGSSSQNVQGHSGSHLTSPDASFVTTMTSITSPTASTTTDQEQSQHEVLLSQSGTICVSSDDDSRNEEEQQQQSPSTLSQEWLPPATSTPLFAAAATTNVLRSERQIENDLFNNIQKLVQEFLRRPNRQYPYYRIMRWTVGEQPKLEHVLTVVINQPAIIL